MATTPNESPAPGATATATAAAAAAPPTSTWREVGLPIVLSGMSVSCATACTNPLDVLKVRLQVMTPAEPGARAGAGAGAGAAAAGAARRSPTGMVDAFVQLVRHEGPLALWKGLTPSLVRAMCYGGLRLGLYQPIVGGIESQSGSGGGRGGGRGGGGGGDGDGDGNAEHKTDMTTKIAAGCASGAFAAALLNPTELIKTRLMADARASSSSLSSSSSSSASAASRGTGATLASIVRHEGVAGLWKGAGMSMTRSAVLTASQCATYDEVKKALMAATGAEDGSGTHLCASMLTGLVTTTVTNPVDMIKTQLYMDKRGNGSGAGAGGGGGGGGGLRGALSAMRMVIDRHGAPGLMRGWSANYVRLGPQTVVTFVALERFRAMAGMTSL